MEAWQFWTLIGILVFFGLSILYFLYEIERHARDVTALLIAMLPRR